MVKHKGPQEMNNFLLNGILRYEDFTQPLTILNVDPVV